MPHQRFLVIYLVGVLSIVGFSVFRAQEVEARHGWILENNQANSGFGTSVAIAGDVDGDSIDDIIVGAPYYDSATQINEGRVYVYRGATTPAFFWGADPTDQAYANFAHSVAGAGDVNADGFDDIVVGAPYWDNPEINEGRVYLYYGGSTGMTFAWAADGGQAGAQLGRSVSSAGDFNADGRADVVAGAPYYDNPQIDEGLVFFFQSPASGPPTIIFSADSNQPGAQLGWSVAAAGFLNDDPGATEYADIVAGAPYYDVSSADEGRAYAFHGRASGGPVLAWVEDGDQYIAKFGYSVSRANFGFAGDDVIIGAPWYSNGHTEEGRAYGYLGGSGGLSNTPCGTFESDQTSARFGLAVSDRLVAAPLMNIDQTDEGWIGQYASCASQSYACSFHQDQAYAWFGYSFAYGNVGGATSLDLVVGAPNYDHGQSDEGVVFGYLGPWPGPACHFGD